MPKSTEGTILNTRLSYKAKNKLQNLAEQTSKELGEKITLSMMIKTAILEVYGVDCDDYEN